MTEQRIFPAAVVWSALRGPTICAPDDLKAFLLYVHSVPRMTWGQQVPATLEFRSKRRDSYFYDFLPPNVCTGKAEGRQALRDALQDRYPLGIAVSPLLESDTRNELMS